MVSNGLASVRNKKYFTIQLFNVHRVRIKRKTFLHVRCTLGGRNLTTRWLLWKSSKRHIMGFLTSSDMSFGHIHSVNGSINFMNHDHIWQVT